MMLPPIDAETLRYAIIGGIGGGAFALLSYALRDRDWLYRRWCTSSLYIEPEDESEYRAFPVTEQERKNLPRQTAWLALVGAAGFASFMSGSEILMLALFAITSVVVIMRVIMADSAATISVDAPTDEQHPITLGKKLSRVGGELGALAFLGVSYLLLPESLALRKKFGMSDDHQSLILGGVLLIVMAMGLYNTKRESRESAVEEDGYVSTWDDGRDIIAPVFFGVGIVAAVAIIVTTLA